MKALAINSSPRGGGQSKTELMLNHLVQGMRDAGAEVDIVHLRKKKIKNCLGCYTCWTKTPGQCVHKDDMTNELLPKMQQSDLIVLATPLYLHSMNAAMSTFMERTLPGAQPFFEQHDGKTFHPLRYRAPKAVWLSVCGFPENTEFDMLSAQLRNLYDHEGLELVAEIYRPAAEVLTIPVFEDKVTDILNATAQAGRELVATLKISSETMARIKQPIIDRSSLLTMGNLLWKTCIAEGVTLKEFTDRKMVPRPDSIENFMMIMPYGLNSQAFCDREVILQFKFSGEICGSCYFKLRDGTVEASIGNSSNPDLTIDSPFDVWIDIITGKTEGQQMFMEQKYKIEGDPSLMLQLFQRGNE
jgi:multimeric flavodoxin WrbA